MTIQAAPQKTSTTSGKADEPRPELAIIETRIYRGANIWSYEKAIHLVVDLGVLEDWPTDRLPRFTERLLAAAPRAAEPLVLAGPQGRLRRAADRGHLARARERARRAPAAAGGRPRPAARQDPPGARRARPLQRDLRVRRRERGDRRGPARRTADQPPGQGRAGLRLRARARGVHRAVRSVRRSGRPPRRSSTRRCPGTSRGSGSTSTRSCSSGRASIRSAIRATMTSNTSSIAVDIASDKDLTGRLLSAAGLPVPRAESVRTADQAVVGGQANRLPGRGEAAGRQPRARGVPRPAERGRRPRRVPDRRGAVAARLGDRRDAWSTGKDYRCLVIDGKIAAIAERVPAHVIGDGRHTVERARRDHQRRPATRCRSREGAHPDQGRRGCRRAGRASRASRCPTYLPTRPWSS